MPPIPPLWPPAIPSVPPPPTGSLPPIGPVETVPPPPFGLGDPPAPEPPLSPLTCEEHATNGAIKTAEPTKRIVRIVIRSSRKQRRPSKATFEPSRNAREFGRGHWLEAKRASLIANWYACCKSVPPMQRFLGLCFLASTAGLFGCSGPTVIDASSHYQLEFMQTGGFDGVHQTTTIDSQAKTISFHGRHGLDQSTVTDAEIAALTKVLNDADLPNGGGPYACTGCADQFTDDAKLDLDGQAFEVKWDDDESSPPNLIALSREMTTLVESKFPGQL
jgi:hypothetical protein